MSRRLLTAFILSLLAFTISPSVARAQSLQVYPILDYVHYDSTTNELTAHFGYSNQETSSVFIPIGSENFFSPPPGARGQPMSFAVGTYHDVFSVTFSLDVTSTLTWTLLGQSVVASNDPSLYPPADLIAALQAQVAALQVQITSLQQQLADCQAQGAALTAQVASLQAQITSLQGQVTQLQAQVAQLQADNAALQTQNSQLQAQVAQLQSQNSALQAQNAQLQSQLTAYQNAVAALITAIQSNMQQVFRNATFVIPGTSPLDQLQTMQTSITNMNTFAKFFLYYNLGGRLKEFGPTAPFWKP